MPAMTYTVATQEQPVVTVTSDGKETQNMAAVNDIIMSGPSQENYVVKAAKFPKLYQGAVGKTVIPEQSPRMVALYRGPQAVTFTAPWGESMVLKPGDYLVKDGDAGYYRIARVEYDQTYNAPGKQGMTEQELDELTRRDFLRGAGAALGGAALAGVAGQAQSAALGSSGTKPTAEFSKTSGVNPLYKVMVIRAICRAEAQGHRRAAGDKPDAFDLTVQKPPYFTGWFDPATIAKAEKVSGNAIENFYSKINSAELNEYVKLKSEADRTVEGAYRSFAQKDKKSAAESMARSEPIYKSLVQNAEQLANKLNQYTADLYGPPMEEEVDEAATPDAVKRIEELVKYK
jgi:archaellum component FlaG (FlaF/FlaG flagellin family)